MLMRRWIGPYIIEKCYDNGSVQIRTIYEEGISLLVNGFRLNTYNKTLIKEEFAATVRTQNLDVIDNKNDLNQSLYIYKRIQFLDENLPKESSTDLRVKTSNGGSFRSEE
jgi:hypothetical protein